MTDLQDKKKALRKVMLAERAKLELDYKATCDILISDKLIACVQEQQFQIIHVYLPMNDEIDIRPFITFLLKNRLKVICPKTLKNRKLSHIELKSLGRLNDGLFGTQYPDSDVVYNGPLDLIVVPGLAFDHSNFRLGYGGGYYDEFLAQHPNATKIGIAYPFQIVKTVPIEDHDVQLDQVMLAENIKPNS